MSTSEPRATSGPAFEARYDLFAAEGRGMPDDAITADVQAIIAAARSVTT